MEFIQDFHYGVRSMINSPGFTLVAVIVLALGIGVNSTIFTVVNSVIIRPLPYPHAEQLMFLWETSPKLDDMSIAYLNFLDWREQNKVFEDIGAFRLENYNLTGIDRPERLQAMQASASLFPTLGVQAAIGRTYREEEDRPGGNPVVVLSDAFWKRRYAGDSSLLGKTLNLSDRSYTVIGVMPPNFNFPNVLTGMDLWVPLGLRADRMQNRGNHPGIYAVARLKPAATRDSAFADLNAIAVHLEEEYPRTNSKNRVGVNPLQERLVEDLRPAFLMLMAAVGFVLLIACANIANLLLARATTRQQEIAIRAALGAARMRIVRQLLTESFLLALLGGVFGFLLAILGTRFLISIIPSQAPRVDEIQVDGSILLFNLAISVLTGLLFGLIPAIRASRIEMNEMLKEGSRTLGGGFSGHHLRKSLVVFEVAMAIFLLIGAGLMMRSFLRIMNTSPGFDPGNLLTLRISLPAAKYADNQARLAFFRGLNESIKNLPGVENAGFSNQFLGGSQTSFYVEGAPPPQPGESDLTDFAAISAEYLDTLGVPLLQGRYFTERELEDARDVVIVDETLVARYWPNQDPIGKRLRLGGGPNSDRPWAEVIGVVGHVKNYGIDAESRVECYIPFTLRARSTTTLVLRSTTNPGHLAGSVRKEVAKLDPHLPIYDIRAVESVLADALAPRRIGMQLLGLFAVLALILAVIGVYGVLSYAVTQSTHEIGIRMALGAQRGTVVRLVLQHGLLLTGIGILIGTAGAVGLSRLMESLLFGVGTTDPLTFAGVPLMLLLVAVVACLIPALRATRIDPLAALRYE